MAIFTLTDIKFGGSQRTGSATGGTLVGGAYESNLFRYPQDLGNYNRGHYMVIHINVQDKTDTKYNYKLMEGRENAPTIIANRLNNATPSLNNAISDIGKNEYTQALGGEISSLMTSVAGGADKIVNSLLPDSAGGVLKDIFSKTAGAIGDVAAGALKSYGDVKGVRTISRTTDTIALYMPDTLNFQNNQGYSDLSLTGPVAAGIAGVAAGARSATSTLQNGGSPGDVSSAIVRNLSPFMLGYVMNRSDIGKSAFATMTGMVENPMLELLYTSPEFRTFRFDFMFYPRSEKEAAEVQNIIARLSFHQAPELKKEYYGFYLVPPSEFDIKFYYNGAENPNVPKISTCVLQSIDIDYAPNGFTAYEVPGQTKPTKGGTGMPVAIRMSLQFKETEILTKANFENGYFGSSNKKQDFLSNAAKTAFDNLG